MSEQPQKPLGREAVKAALAHAPQSPGVYLMKDARGRVIYVGKAKRLRTRLGNYARQIKAPSWYRHKIESMVASVAAVDYVVTSSEKEALILEKTLIKKHRPRYNVDLRDDKSYPYFRLSLKDDFPRLSLVRRPRLGDGAKYYGPFDSAGAARQTMYMLQRIFPLRRCSDRQLNNRSRPCLDYEMGRCPAPCVGKISQTDYAKLAQDLSAFFAGKGQELAARLKRRMEAAARDERFEQAAMLRDRWQALARTLERQQVDQAADQDMDAVALHSGDDGQRLAQVRVRGGQMVASRVHDLSRAATSPEQSMAQALLMLYDQAGPPPLVLVSHMPTDPSLVAEVLGEKTGRKVELRLPQRGDKKGVLEIARLNAAQARQAEGGEAEVLGRLRKKLELSAPPERMECLDISHLGGSLTVAGLSAMANGKKDSAHYRRYKVLGVGPGDDYAAMNQVLARRLDGKDDLPDLLVLDGGKGQLNIAVGVLRHMDLNEPPALASIAKGRQPGEPDRIFLPGRKNPVNLKEGDPALRLLMRLRDEAHRFAVGYHRLLRKKALTRSILDEVPGVGPKKKAKLLKSFGSLAALKKADAARVVELGGLDRATAEAVVEFLGALDTADPSK